VKRYAVAALAITAALLAASRLVGKEPAAEFCFDAETRERARALTIEGFDAGLRNYNRRIFDVWMRDGQDDPNRATAGMKNGIDAYGRARAAIQQWQPPTCKGDKQ
jgi:hypothetical protein